ncbi:MAG TPA: N-acetylneuraminate synthase family protein [bacterium]|mgnify:CR=1 FL=1|nr:N-acetylneuraminate synthase family protein [bacterium]
MFKNLSKVFIILEIGCNWEGDFERAKEMVMNAAKAGVDAVKFQTVIAEKIATKWAEKFWDIEGCPGATQYEEFAQSPYLTVERYIEIKKICKEKKIVFFSTAEDEDSVDTLEKVGTEFHKISSMNITHFPLIKKMAQTGKPLIISTGASSINEIKEAVEYAEKNGAKDIALLHCISNYPVKDENANINMILDLKKHFPDKVIGYSDHTLPEYGDGIICAAAALGARIIEKHYSFDNTRTGFDHEISVDYNGLKSFVTSIRRTEKALGQIKKEPIESEFRSRKNARRSIVANRDISAGEILSIDMLAIKRPAGGIEPKFFEIIIGKKTSQNISADELLLWNKIIN